MGEVNTHAGNVRLVGGRLCLDYVNTVDSHLKPQPKEYLHSYADLLRWCHHAGALTSPAAERLAVTAAAHPSEAEALLDLLRELRAALFRLCVALIEEHSPAPRDLALLNAVLADAPARTRLEARAGELVWQLPPPELALPLWQIAWSAADLLTSPEARLLRQCAGPGCSWLFLDTTPTRSRRWCSMEDCGNRAKARRHYRKKGREAGGAE